MSISGDCVDKRTVFRLLKSGKLQLQIVHIGESPPVRRADLEAYLERLAADAAEAEAAARRAAAARLWERRHRHA